MKGPRDIADHLMTANVPVCRNNNRSPRLLLLRLLLMLTALPVLATGQPSPALELKARITLPNVTGRMDHLGVDIKGRRLFATAFNNHTVEVIDLQAAQRVRTFSDLAEPQGALYDPSINRLFVSSSMDGTVKIFDGTTFQMLATVKLSSDADNLRYDAHSNRVVVGYGGEKFLRGKPVRGQGDGALVFLDSTGKKNQEIPLDAHPESFQIEKSGTRVFVNVPDHKEVEVADVVKDSLLAHWPVTTCADNFPMTLDEAHHRLFVACRTPALLLVLDTESGKTVASHPIVEHTDDLFYDASKGRIYILGEGFIEAWQQKDPDHYDKIGRYPTPAGARTGLFVPDWGKLFVAVPDHGKKEAEILVFETR
jgi:DNA-binding beta-propeller fold protein YncE